MSRPKVLRSADPKPCPRCYAPMRPTSGGFECARHGIAVPDCEVAVTRTARPKAKREKRVRVSQPRRDPVQTQLLAAARETIVERNRAGESIASIAADLWQHLGYKDRYVCASKISRFLGLRGVDVAAVRPGPQPGSRSNSRFTDERGVEVRTALASGESVWAFAGRRWQEWGFSSRSSCDSLIRKWIRVGAVR